MAYLHERGVKGFVTLNVLLFDEELEKAEEAIRTIAAGGADAVIVQVSSVSGVHCSAEVITVVSNTVGY